MRRVRTRDFMVSEIVLGWKLLYVPVGLSFMFYIFEFYFFGVFEGCKDMTYSFRTKSSNSGYSDIAVQLPILASIWKIHESIVILLIQT